MHAATVDLMMQKARFESDTAIAVAEAFDIAIQHAQLVTVPMLDARLAKVDARFVEFEAKMDVRFAQIENNMVAQFATAKAEQNARFTAADERISRLEARIDSLEATMEARFAFQDASIDKKLADLKAELVRWVFLAVLGNAALTASVNALMNSFQHLR